MSECVEGRRVNGDAKTRKTNQSFMAPNIVTSPEMFCSHQRRGMHPTQPTNSELVRPFVWSPFLVSAKRRDGEQPAGSTEDHG